MADPVHVDSAWGGCFAAVKRPPRQAPLGYEKPRITPDVATSRHPGDALLHVEIGSGAAEFGTEIGMSPRATAALTKSRSRVCRASRSLRAEI
ncbi:hypothetical protein AB0A70_19310 [Streptomyces morookaense]|uniref:hypothetical protein n=1 Tax=Streptomyces morookaense TaxID=1970 RepID=UPI0033CAB04D